MANMPVITSEIEANITEFVKDTQNEKQIDRESIAIAVEIKDETETQVEVHKKTNYLPSKSYLIVKRIMDILISASSLIILSPLLLVIAIFIKLEDGGPIIYHRWCLGKNGKYDMLKFRTMVTDADNLEKYLSSEQIKEYKKNVKLDHDPRITKVGKVIRKLSLDELLQLVSILRGDMSIVGPRPIVESESIYFGDRLSELLEAKPGLTGYWQVNGRSDCTYESGKRQELELYYVEHRSLLLDIKIFFNTFGVVIKMEGAR